MQHIYLLLTFNLSAGSFEILVYTDKELLVPESWGETGPAIIADSREVKFRSFSTTIHKVDGMVSYKVNPL